MKIFEPDFGHLFTQSSWANSTNLVILICINDVDIEFQWCSVNRWLEIFFFYNLYCLKKIKTYIKSQKIKK